MRRVEGRIAQPAIGELAVRAIQEHRVVRFTYQTLEREVEPHLVGIHEAGEAMLLGYQTGGRSRSGELPGWRTFVLSEIADLELLDRRFSGSRADFDPGERFVEIFART